MSDDFTKVRVFGIDESELSTGSVNDNEVGTISAKKIKAHTITSDQIAAGSIGALQLQAGAITAFKVTVPNRVKGTTVVFSVSDANKDTLQWTSGIVYLQKMKYTPNDTMGDLQVVTVQQTINSGSYKFVSGDSAYYFYIEWAQDQYSDEPLDSATLTMKKSTTYPSSDTAVVLAYAWYDSVLGLSQFQALDTAGGGVRISGNSIIAGSITTSQLNFTPIIGSSTSLSSQVIGSINASTEGIRISGSKIIIDGNVLFTSGYDPTTKVPVGGAANDVNNGTTTINGGKITTGSITANQIAVGTITADRLAFPAFDKSIDNLDSISDGISYKKVSVTQINTFTDGSSRAIAYIGVDGKYQTVLQSTAYADPYQSGLYLTAQHLGFYNASLGGWTVDIRSTGEMFLGSQYNNQYLYWDGNTLTVRGNIEANSVSAGISISSAYISGGTINGTNFIQSSLSSQLNGLVAYGNQSYTSWYNYGQEVGRIIYEYDGEFNESSFKFSGYGTVGVKSTGGKLNLYGYQGVNIYSSTYITQSLIVSGDLAVFGNINSSIRLGYGYGIQFYSQSGLGGNFWYSGGKLYFKDENGTQHQISYT